MFNAQFAFIKLLFALKGVNNMNWKTSAAGLVAALLQLAKTVLPSELAPVFDTGAAFAIALLGYFAADKGNKQ